jgi:hypothetical protein
MVSFSVRLGKLSIGLSIPFTRLLDVVIILSNWSPLRMDLAAISAHLGKYENKWVAIDESEERIVGVGNNAFEATEDAERSGHHDTILFKVPSFDSALN